MLKGLKIAASVAVTASLGLAGAAFANCQQEGPYEFRQCGITWFAPPPAGSGAVSTFWWQLGFGNANLFQSATQAAQDGSAFLSAPSPGLFIGNDSGSLNTVDLGLIDASQFGGPAGSLCFGAISNWGSPGIDGCGDNNRNSYGPGATANISDQYLNVYWDPAFGPGLLYYSAQEDAPMGVMMKESTGTDFALAFFASRSRGKSPDDFSPGDYNVGALINGDPSPTGPNVIPWQHVPQPTISAVLATPADPNSLRNLTINWTAARFVHDGSTRPCFQPDGTTGCVGFPLGVAPGVGVLDQGALIHYDLESTTLDTATGLCGAVWTKVTGASVNHPGTTMNANGIPANTCVRLATRLGKNPAVAFRTVPLAANLTANRLDSQSGRFGDVGYQVESRATKVGGPTVSQKATLTVASKNKNMISVSWETTSELNVTGFDILGIDGKGGVKVVGSKTCTQCNSGLGASYTELIPSGTFQGSKKVQVRMQPSGDLSNTLDLK